MRKPKKNNGKEEGRGRNEKLKKANMKNQNVKYEIYKKVKNEEWKNEKV